LQTSDLHISAAPVKFGYIAVSSSGANAVVKADGTALVGIPGKKIRFLFYNIMSNGTVNAKWQSVGTATTDKTGLKYMVANTGISVPFCPVGCFETNVGEAPSLNLSGSVAVGGEFAYQEVG
jgi:hypothetical protein